MQSKMERDRLLRSKSRIANNGHSQPSEMVFGERDNEDSFCGLLLRLPRLCLQGSRERDNPDIPSGCYLRCRKTAGRLP